MPSNEVRKIRKRKIVVCTFICVLLHYYCFCWYKTTNVKSELPDALLVGVKKAGTGALAKFLNMHPDISFTGHEVKFFNHIWNYAKGYRWYISQLAPRKHEKALKMEKTPSYFHYPSITRRLWEMDKNLKIMIVVRDPVARTVSDHTQEVVSGKYGGSFEQKLLNRFREVDPQSDLLSPSLYAKHLRRFLNYFPRENIHIIDGDNLIKQNPYIQLSKIEKFLNLSSHFDRSQFTFVPEKGFYCTARKTNGPSCASKSKGRKHVAVNEKTKEKLRQFLVEPNLEFFQLSGMNFSWNDSL